MSLSPRLFDPSLCGRSDLACLDKETSLQWIARVPPPLRLGPGQDPGSGISCSHSRLEMEVEYGVVIEKEKEKDVLDYIVVTREIALGEVMDVDINVHILSVNLIHSHSHSLSFSL